MELVIALVALLLATFGMVLHYVTKWKTAATLTTDDEHLLEELYQLARRLEKRMDTVERLVADEHPEFRPSRIAPLADEDEDVLRDLDRVRQLRERRIR